MKQEALYWQSIDGGKVRCELCPHNCLIPLGKTGICKVRENMEGKLWTLIYGDCSSVAVDPIEKKPLRHFHPGTNVLSVGSVSCNMHCKHCQNYPISRADTAYTMDFISPLNLIDLAKRYDCAGVAWTYNEPTIWYEYTLESAKRAKEHGLYTVYVTNGYINEAPLDELAPYLDAYCVDLKGFTQKFYQEVCGIPDFEPILKAISRAKNKWQMHVEVVTNIIPTYNDDDEQLTGIATWIKENLGSETVWEVTRFFPYLEMKHLPPTPLETLQRAKLIGESVGLKNVYLGNV